MPERAESWPRHARFCLTLILALTGAAIAQAANEARWGIDRAGQSASLFFSLREAGNSLLGFHCGSVSSASASVFTADPAYSEPEPTFGLELVSGLTLQGEDSGRAGVDDAAGAEGRTPLRVQLRRVAVDGVEPSLADGGEVEEVPLSGASKSVADLVAACGR